MYYFIYVSICTYFAAYFKISFIVENDPKAFGWQQRRASLPSR